MNRTTTGAAEPRSHDTAASVTLDALLDPALTPLFWHAELRGGVSAWWSHVPFAHWLVANAKPRVLVELGTHNGVSYSALCQAVQRGGLATRCYAVDTWRGDNHSGKYGEEIYEQFRRFHDERFGAFSALLRCTFDEALGAIADRTVDLLHIDGEHTFEAVRHDFESWLPKLSDEAVVLFHDTNERRDDFGVWRLWRELCERYPNFEFLHGHGLGVLAVGKRSPQVVVDLCTLTDPSQIAALRDRFAAFGERWSVDAEFRRFEREVTGQLQAAAASAEAARAGRERADADLRREIERVRADALAQAKAESERSIETIRRQAENQVASAAANAKSLAQAVRLAERRADTAEATALAAAARAAAIEGSTIWRATRPLRKVLARFPNSHHHARRMLRVGWWTVTLQLPTRLRERRAQRAKLRDVAAPPVFDAGRSLPTSPDVAASVENSPVHQMDGGTTERPDPDAEQALARLVASSPLFDRDWYLAKYPDVAAAGVDPALHYVKRGRVERRSPGPNFDAGWYLTTYPDVAASGTNPLLHYLQHGIAEGRKTRYVDPYRQWVEEYDILSEADRVAIRAHIEELGWQPTISVVVPVYNTDEHCLHDMIESVRQQIYPRWELCIADDASTAPPVRRVLEEFREQDPRIKVVYRADNGHISAATNSALEMATGDFVALLDHDDVLAEHALYMVAHAIDEHPDADILYSDEDKLDAAGRRVDPYFKPDWNEELFYGQNFVSHLGVYRTSSIRAVGGFRSGFEGSQDYDLTLRLKAATRGPIVHIPHILYHWRIFAGATTYSSTQVDGAALAARRAIREHLESLGERATVLAASAGNYHRVIHQEPDRWPKVSVIVPTRDHVELLAQCIKGLLEGTDYPDLEIIIADNESIDAKTTAFFVDVARRGVRIVPSPGAFNFSRINNAAAREARGDVLLFLNNDIAVIDRTWLKEMILHAARPGVGAVGARLLYPDGTIQHGGVVLGVGGLAGHIHRGAPRNDPGYFGRLMLTQDISCITAACMAVPKVVFEKVGGFDEENLAVAFNDVDLCIRIREAGYRIIWTPYAELYHGESKSRGSDQCPTKIDRFHRELRYVLQRWPRQIAADPFFNPNLSLETAEADLAFPPRVRRPWLPRETDSTRSGIPQTDTTPAAVRAAQLLAGLDRSARIIEIGPSYNPIAPKADGWNTRTLDHTTRASLIEKYAGQPAVDAARIEDVDFVWTSGSVADAVPSELHGTFDAFIASHVIEHTTDVVGFLDAAARLLSPAGRVILAVPDKRYCFDYFRPLTTTGDALEARAARRSRHAPRTVFNHLAYVVKNAGAGAWGQTPVQEFDFEFFHSLEDAAAAFQDLSEALDPPYVDSHAWQFTPESFELLLLELARLGHTDWRVERITPPTGCEFHVWLRRGGMAAAAALSPTQLAARRLALLNSMLRATREATAEPVGAR